MTGFDLSVFDNWGKAPVAPEPAPPDNVFRWGTVTATSPALLVRLDGDTDPLASTPDSLIDRLNVGDRVWCQIYRRRVIVIGTPVGPPVPEVPQKIYSLNRDFTTGIALSPAADWTDSTGLTIPGLAIGTDILTTLELVVNQEKPTEQTVRLDIVATGATVKTKRLVDTRFANHTLGYEVTRLVEQFHLVSTSATVTIRLRATCGLGPNRLVLPAGYITAILG